MKVYDNLLDNISFSAQDIENQIKNYNLRFIQYRNQEVEFGIRFPMFLPSFYKYVLEKQTIPNQEQYSEIYIRENFSFFRFKNYSVDIIKGLKARLFRTYPSLIRDLHFCLFLKDSKKFDSVLYNTELDIQEGIDVLIGLKNQLFAVNLYTNTRNACSVRNNKEFRHNKSTKYNYIELPVDFNGSKKCGNFFLYGEREFSNVNKIIHSKINTLLMN